MPWATVSTALSSRKTSENSRNSPLCSDTRGTFRRARWAERGVCDAGDDYVRIQSLFGIGIPPSNCTANLVQPRENWQTSSIWF
jgi:hypothetical protein